MTTSEQQYKVFKKLIFDYLKSIDYGFGTFFGKGSIQEYIIESETEGLKYLSSEEAFRKFFPLLKKEKLILWNYSELKEDISAELKDLEPDEINPNVRSPNVFFKHNELKDFPIIDQIKLKGGRFFSKIFKLS